MVASPTDPPATHSPGVQGSHSHSPLLSPNAFFSLALPLFFSPFPSLSLLCVSLGSVLGTPQPFSPPRLSPALHSFLYFVSLFTSFPPLPASCLLPALLSTQLGLGGFAPHLRHTVSTSLTDQGQRSKGHTHTKETKPRVQNIEH